MSMMKSVPPLANNFTCRELSSGDGSPPLATAAPMAFQLMADAE